MARGYAISIGLLLAIPAALIGGLAVALIRAGRRTRIDTLERSR
jgi:hypothetical protein